MSKLLPPFHKVMTSDMDCHLANDRIAEIEAELAHQKLLTEDSEEYAEYQAGLNRKSQEQAHKIAQKDDHIDELAADADSDSELVGNEWEAVAV